MKLSLGTVLSTSAIVKAASKLSDTHILAITPISSEKVQKLAEFIKQKTMVPGVEQIKYWPDGKFNIILVTNEKRYTLSMNEYKNLTYLKIKELKELIITIDDLNARKDLNYIPGQIEFRDHNLTGRIFSGVQWGYKGMGDWKRFTEEPSFPVSERGNENRQYFQSMFDQHVEILLNFYAKGSGN